MEDTEMQASTSVAAAPVIAASSSNAKTAKDRHIINTNDYIVIRLPSGLNKTVHLKSGLSSIAIGKHGHFSPSSIIGHPYGLTYELLPSASSSNLCQIRPIQGKTMDEIQATEATNELILAAGAQKLTQQDIEDLKNEGLSGRDIIEQQISSHASFELKNEYSKQKYLKRKESKYIPMFTVLPPSVWNVVEHFAANAPLKIREIRVDTLACMCNAANLRPGSKVIVSEDMGGVLIAAILEGLAGEGTVMNIHPNDSPAALPLQTLFNLPPAYMSILRSMNWSVAEPDWEPQEGSIPAIEQTEGKVRTRTKKRSAAHDQLEEVRKLLHDGNYDAFVMSSPYDPTSVIQKVMPYLAGSAQIVVHSPHVQILAAAQQTLKFDPNIIALSIHEPFMRQYQVLPGRSHPVMQGIAHGGYYMTGIRVLVDETSQDAEKSKAAKANRKRKRR